MKNRGRTPFGTGLGSLRSVSEMKWPSILLALALAGCGDIPRDVEGTLERVRSERLFRVGLIEGPHADGRVGELLRRIERAAGARAAIEPGAAEPLLAKLEAGALDIVIGPMATTSPWKTHVHFLPPLSLSTGTERELSQVAMARNGENGWISLLDREARAVGASE